MIDHSWIGHEFAPLRVDVEPGRLRQFAKAIGEARAEYVDPKAARAMGWPGLPVPPTLLFGLEMEQPDPWHFLEVIGVDLRRVLHGEQEFEYHAQAWSGDQLTFKVRIMDVYDKRGGSLEFVTKKSTVTNQDDVHIADLRSLLVVRNEATR